MRLDTALSQVQEASEVGLVDGSEDLCSGFDEVDLRLVVKGSELVV